MPLDRPGLLSLAQRLRDLRENRWPGAGLTQAAVAKALSSEEHLSPATVSSWESSNSPKLPPRSRITAYARFFATRRSVETDPPQLLPLAELNGEERDAFTALELNCWPARREQEAPGQGNGGAEEVMVFL